MLNKNIDYALVGHNYLTFLLSLGLNSRGKNVLMLDDERFNYGEFFLSSITQLDLEFILLLSKNVDFSKYISTEDRLFFIGKKQLKLGLSPGRNLMELCRKFPNIFLLKSKFSFNEDFISLFDLEYKSFCEKSAYKITHNEKKIKLFQLFSESLEINLKEVLENLFAAISKKDELVEAEKVELITLLYLTRGYYQGHFSTSGSKTEFFHILLCLLSPHYKLDYESLNKELLAYYVKNNGEFKKVNLSELNFQKSKIKGIELDSYEGLIQPKKIVFVGGHPIGLPINFRRPKNVYNCLKVILKTKPIAKKLIGQKIIFTSAIKISTTRPMFEASFFQDKIELNVVIAKKNGVKISFIKSQIIEELLLDLKYLYNEEIFQVIDAELHFTNDIFIEEVTTSKILKDEMLFSKKLNDLIFYTAPLLYARPKNVYYLGPYNDGYLGTLSSLLEIYRWQDKI